MHFRAEKATNATRVKFGSTPVQQQDCGLWI
jgi:hypothetical protein